MVVFCIFVVDVYDVYFLHLAPFYATAIHVGDAVGREVGNLDAERVLALAQGVAAIQDKRYRQGAAYKMIVDIDTC